MTEDDVLSLQLTHHRLFGPLFISGWVSSQAPSTHLYLSIHLSAQL